MSALRCDPERVLVREATIEDAAAMAAVMTAVAEEGVIGTEPPVDADDLAQRFRRTIEDAGRAGIWVLEEAGRVLGHVGVREPGAHGVLVLGMVILPEGRGRGGGRELLDRALEHAQSSGAHKVELEVWPDNARAIALYARAGFEVEGLRKAHYRRRDGSLRSALIMARLLGG